eukprot:2918860-Pleurochrysis_carterae.AAC.1
MMGMCPHWRSTESGMSPHFLAEEVAKTYRRAQPAAWRSGGSFSPFKLLALQASRTLNFSPFTLHAIQTFGPN